MDVSALMKANMFQCLLRTGAVLRPGKGLVLTSAVKPLWTPPTAAAAEF